MKQELAMLEPELKQIGVPEDFFSGVEIHQGLSPDNIIIFKRTDTSGLRPEGVTTNYHHRFELLVVIHRGGHVRIGEKSYALEEGEAALVFPYEFHHYMDVEAGELEWVFVTFELKNECNMLKQFRGAPRKLNLKTSHAFRNLVHEWLKDETQRDGLELSYQLAQLLKSLVECPVIDPKRCDLHGRDEFRDSILERINQYVRAHLMDGITIGSMAQNLNYSVSHLRAVFRNQLGVSLGKYIRESRLSEAAKLLHQGNHNVSEIGELCGFESLYAFSRAFKKAYGISPKKYGQIMFEKKDLQE